MTAGKPAETIAPPGNVPDPVSLDALVILAANRLALGADVAAAKFINGQEIDDPVRERDILKGAAGELNGSGRGIGMAFLRDQIEASKVVQRALHARWRTHPREAPVSCRGLAEEVRPELDLVNQRMLALLARMSHLPRTSHGHIDGLFDRKLSASASPRLPGELRQAAADIALRSFHRK